MEITAKQRKSLEKLAHDLKPVIQIGKNGVNPKIIQAIDRELTNHELIKIKFIDYKEVRGTLSSDIQAETNSIIVKMIGNMLILFRANEDGSEESS
jgi:RNA-binding protein